MSAITKLSWITKKPHLLLAMIVILIGAAGRSTLPIVTGERVSFAAAANCDSVGAPNYHASGFTNPGGTYWGGRATFPEQSYTAADASSGGFVANVLWSLFPSGYWVEVGFTKGWEGQDIYAFYEAENRPTYGYSETKLSKTPGGTGTSHTYYIYPASTGQTWWAQVDSTNYLGVNMLTNNSTSNIQVGGEMTSSSSTMGSTTSSSLKYYTGRNKGSATNWPNSSATTCKVRSPMSWDWVSFPTSGKAWK